jgi:hypothetical protein
VDHYTAIKISKPQLCTVPQKKASSAFVEVQKKTMLVSRRRTLIALGVDKVI